MKRDKFLLYLQLFFSLGFLIVSQFNLVKQIDYPQITSDAYRNGYFINYLLIYIWIGDIFLLGIIITSLLRQSYKALSKLEMSSIFLLFGYFIFHLSLFNEFVNFWYLFRIGIFFISGILTLKLIKELTIFKNLLIRSYILKAVFLITSISIIFQTILAYLQNKAGTSIGLQILGESKVVQGMINSSFIEIDNTYVLRGYGTFPHPNILSGYLLIFIIIVLLYLKSFYKKSFPNKIQVFKVQSFSCQLSKKFLKVISISLIIIAAIGIYLTYSRISLLLFILIIVILIISLFYKRKTKLLAINPSVVIFERFSQLLSGNDLSSKDRLKLFNKSIEMIKENPWGVGWQNFTAILSNSPPRSANGISLIQPVHNSFMLLINENGIFAGGLLIILGVILSINILISSNEKVFSLIILLTLYIISFWDHYLISLPQGNSLIFISAMILYWLSQQKYLQIKQIEKDI